MIGDLITLPLRLWFRSAQLVTRAAVGATGRAVSFAGDAVQTVTPGGSNGATSYAPPPPAEDERLVEMPAEDEWPPESSHAPADDEWAPAEEEQRPAEPSGPPSDPRRELVEDRVPAAEPRFERPPATREVPAPPVQAPPSAEAGSQFEPPGPEDAIHVSEEPELVREEAERGAEEGVGAGVTVMEPWEGYTRMSARDVIVRISIAGSAELAAVRLYESHHRGRQTVLAAVDRQLKTVDGGDRPA